MASVPDDRWPEAGCIEPGSYADLVTVSLDSVRLVGAAPDHLGESVVFAASPADVRQVYVSGDVRPAGDARRGRRLVSETGPRP